MCIVLTLPPPPGLYFLETRVILDNDPTPDNPAPGERATLRCDGPFEITPDPSAPLFVRLLSFLRHAALPPRRAAHRPSPGARAPAGHAAARGLQRGHGLGAAISATQRARGGDGPQRTHAHIDRTRYVIATAPPPAPTRTATPESSRHRQHRGAPPPQRPARHQRYHPPGVIDFIGRPRPSAASTRSTPSHALDHVLDSFSPLHACLPIEVANPSLRL